MMTLLVQVTYGNQRWVEARYFQTLPEQTWVDGSGRVHRLISMPVLNSKILPENLRGS